MNHEHGYFEEDHIGNLGDLQLWRRILQFSRPEWRWTLVAVILSFIVTGTSLLLPYLMQIGIDRYIVAETLPMEERRAGLALVGGLFLIVIVAGFVTNFFQVLVLELTGQRIMHALREQLFGHIVDLNLSFFQAHPVGRLVTRLTNDIQNMHEMFTSVIVTLFNDAVRLAGILAVLFWMNWRLALLLSTIFPIMIVITLWFGRLSRDAFRQIRSHLAAINAFIQEVVQAISVIQIFLRERDVYRRFQDLNGRYYRSARYQINVFGIFVPLIEVMSSVALALIVWYGGGEIVRGAMTIGMLTAFISYMRLFFQPLRELSQKYSLVQSALASAERIFQILENRDSLPVVRQPLIPDLCEGALAFQDVDFGYEPGRTVIRRMSFRVAPGETLAIVGATGSGKTTLINLLERFYDPGRGRILLDGRDLRELDVKWLREQVGLVMQDVFIVPGTMRENILLDRELSDEAMANILELSQLAALVKTLPQGLETRVGEGGMDLSAGQRQLLAFARVLVKDPRILVLDEATANVDTETEMLIERAIQAALSRRTSLVIAHRLSTIRRADRILVVDSGRIAEEGAHEALMERQGLYYHLQSLQNGGA